jgi:CHAT domain-containing protein
LYILNINPDLVVLSAYETGIGKLYKSEGAMSIARGFQFAGAQNLFSALESKRLYNRFIYGQILYLHL